MCNNINRITELSCSTKGCDVIGVVMSFEQEYSFSATKNLVEAKKLQTTKPSIFSKNLSARLL